MTKYSLIYKNDNNESIFCGSFIGKNHYKIKFVMYINVNLFICKS